jgi:hypothetical protein
MITTNLEPGTGLPMVQETRPASLWMALPREIAKLATDLDATETTAPWWPRHHLWEGMVNHAALCWKCGTPVKGWRQLLISNQVGFDKEGNPILTATANPVKIAGQPAVAFLPYHHLTSTLVQIRFPKLDQMAVFAAQHCTDCMIGKDDLDKVVACLLAGADANLMNARNHGHGAALSRDRWATYLLRWSNVEPITTVTIEEAQTMQRIPAPGELLTAAQLMVDFDAAKRAQVPAGATVEFAGTPPPGWASAGAGKIVKL